jgi:ABC-type uncharacterized transport system auxiliary subunit
MKNILILCTVLALAGCASQQRAIKYYTLDMWTNGSLEGESVGKRAPLPFAVEIIDFAVSGPYNDTRIALRTDSNELQYYHYHQWAELPGPGFRHFLWRVLYDANVFDAAHLRMTVRPPELVVSGAIKVIERLDTGDRSGVRIDASIELIDTRQQDVLIIHDFHRLESFPGDSPMNRFAQEASRIFHEEIAAFIEKIHAHFPDE